MASNDYAFLSRWRVQGAVAQVDAVLRDAASLPRWWPSVYLEVRILVPVDARGARTPVELPTQGRPDGFTLEAAGDFDGRGVWTFVQDGAQVDVTYDWRIRARKPLLRTLSWLLKPVFAANHRWAMRRGEESLVLELRRRRART